MEHRGTPPKDRPAPTPVNRLGPFFKRQHKYHPARPYRWWEFKPTPPGEAYDITASKDPWRTWDP